MRKYMVLSTNNTMTREKFKNLNDIDQEISNIIRQGSTDQVKHLLLYMDTFVKLLRIYFTGVNYGNAQIKKIALAISAKGGPQYFYDAATFFAETEFRHKMNFSDIEYQEYLYLRAEAKEKWDAIELKLRNISC